VSSGNDYGQLGQGNQFDNPEPKLVNGLDKIISFSAGLRHSAAIMDGRSMELFVWGFNGYGELGLGDTEIRLQPTKVSAIKNR
jgi:alpha-tubulin suppressor-like RCC1 family protein